LNAGGNQALLADYQATGPTTFDFGQRLFQAARFVTEMEYQHLVFEEFARKIQPAVRPFHLYHSDINAAIPAEFAHAVYRFGHSMLNDEVSRQTRGAGNVVKDNSVPLLTAFLNPPLFFDNSVDATHPVYSPAEAAGAVVMGTSDQVGNELDEFVVETLRDNLLGLPLDLPTINMTRARDAGVPSLNTLRRQIFADTNDGQLAPYTSWSDFGQHLKHPESLINFVAAYGTHPSIRDSGPDGVLNDNPGTPANESADNVTTVAAKRAAARAIVDPLPSIPAGPGPDGIFVDNPATGVNEAADNTPAITGDIPPADAAEFMFSAGPANAWGTPEGAPTNTGLESVDLWVGGLAEVTNLFGGLLGSTFNYVFEHTLENLQDGDRLYYLARTPGMNLRTQLEGNSFSEMIMRNTDASTLKADAFSTADCKFQLANLNGTPAGFTTFGSTVADDPTSECAENLLLLRKPDGTIQYKAINTVDPSGINGQSVYNGTDNADRVFGGNDNDTFWGGLGNDVIEGNGGDDIALGGLGNDIITDLGGADVEKGGPGNDALDGGIGDDIFMGGDGQDFINGGANDNEGFAGPGTDFIIAGQGADAFLGDGGDDWIQGGSGQDLLIGDHSAPFFDDPSQVTPGNDVFVGQVGENDYDAEGGDDLMAQNAAIDRNAGAGGFDWAFHQYDTVGADDDMEINNNLVGVPIQIVVNRDRWQETEADSGSQFNDIIRGSNSAGVTVGGAGFTGCDALDQAGLNRIPGLDPIVPTLNTNPAAAGGVVALSAAGFCPLSGQVWGDGDILIGGLGSDTIEGRGNDDVIDGDRYLTVAIALVDDAGAVVSTTDLMEHKALTGLPFGGAANMTLQQAVFAGLVDPGKLVIKRAIVTPAVGPDCGAASPVNCDVAVFSGPRANYTITGVLAGTGPTQAGVGNDPFVRVTDVSAVPVDGSDVIRNVEQLRFTDATVSVPGAPTIGTATAASARATVTWTAPASNGGLPITGYRVQVLTGTTVVNTVPVGNVLTATVLNLTNGTDYNFRVQAVNVVGAGPLSAASNIVTPVLDITAPTVLTTTPAANATGVAVDTNVTAAFSEDVTGVNAATTFRLRIGNAGAFVPATVTYDTLTHVATLNPTANLVQGVTYRATLTGGTTAIRDLSDNPLVTTSWTFTTFDNTAPTVTARTPAANATAVVVSVNVTATFSEAVNGVTAANVTLRVGTDPAGALVPAAFSFTAGTVTLNPNANLLPDTRYTVRLNNITDIAGNQLAAASTSWTFLTGPAPTVTARTPTNNATAVTVPVSPTATFSEPVSGVTAANVTVRVGAAANGTLVPSDVLYDPATGVVTINPAADLLPDTRYTVRLTNITDVAGNPLAAASTSWTFLTGPAPSVIARTPAVNATGVVRASNQTATFSEPMSAATVIAANATLRLGTTATGTLIARVVTYNAVTRVMTINPTATLAPNTVYTIRLTNMTDAAGNPLPTATWSFTTGAV